MSAQWWSEEDQQQVMHALLNHETSEPMSYIAETASVAAFALAALAPTVERIRREAKAEALREAAREVDAVRAINRRRDPALLLSERADRIEAD
jgi:hypothetical protein